MTECAETPSVNLLQRHLFKNVFFTCAAAAGLFAFVLMLGNFIRDLLAYLIAGQIGLGAAAKLVGLLLPFVVSYALPMGLLTGVLLVLGRMSAQHEITAMRAAGLSLLQINAPILLLAVLGVGATLAVNFYTMPWARVTYHHELAEAVRTSPRNFVVPRTFIHDFPGVVVYVGEKDGDQLRDVWVWELDARKRVTRFDHAQAARVDFDEQRDMLVLTLVQGTTAVWDPKAPFDYANPQMVGSFGEANLALSMEKLFGKKTFSTKQDWLTYGQLMAEWRALRPPAPAGQERARRLDRMKVQMVIQKKFADAFTVLSFALLGIPLGIKISRKETSANLGLALALVMGYYFLTVCVGWMDQHPAWRPDLLMWAPNFLFQGLGLWLFWRVDRR